ncbi:hypothetical protein BUE80_DR008986 [Diplocarpon rosae]|nr:hypothetical protein BUE80_DR008986 [Diplocarpon rosae]
MPPSCFLVPTTSLKRAAILRTHAWIPLGHTPTEIRTRLLSNKTSAVATSIDRFHHRDFQNLALRVADQTPEDLLEGYFHSFNSMFFFNALTVEFCSLTLMPRLSEQWRTNFGVRGESKRGLLLKREQEGVEDRTQTKVGILIFERPDLVDDEERLRSYLGAMLKEMIWAFVGVHTCCCQSCEDESGEVSIQETWRAVAVWAQLFAKEKLSLDLDVLGDGV